MKILSLVAFLVFAVSVEARTVWLSHPDGNWATIILESRRSHSRDEALCQSGDALRLFDALKIRAEAGTDAAVKEILLSGLRLKCENVTGFGFVSCSLHFSRSANVVIDSTQESLRASWEGPEAEEFSKIWDHDCAGLEFKSDDSRFVLRKIEDKYELSYHTP